MLRDRRYTDEHTHVTPRHSHKLAHLLIFNIHLEADFYTI